MPAVPKKRGDRGGVRPPWSSLLLVVGLAALYALWGPVPEALVFDRTAIANGEVWRLVTGHLVHADGVHLAANGAALLLLGGLTETGLRLPARAFWATVGVGIAAVDLMLWRWTPDLQQYCGFSGVLNAIFVVAVYGLWRCSGDSVFRWVATGGLLKIAIENRGQAALLPLSSLPSVTEAHFAGFAAGLLACVAFIFWTSLHRRRPVDWHHATVSRSHAAHP